MKLNLIKEIFSSGLTNKLIKIISDKRINLIFADNLILSSKQPIKKMKINEKKKIIEGKDSRKPKIPNVFDLLITSSYIR
jgi:hypothetical protein